MSFSDMVGRMLQEANLVHKYYYLKYNDDDLKNSLNNSKTHIQVGFVYSRAINIQKSWLAWEVDIYL